jgi:N-hydroxyarylamine O-acetyltransferase
VIERLLHAIGVDADADLATVHRAYLEHVTYEDVAVQLGESGPLDETRLLERVLGGRGGYCFELNSVLALLLRELGHDVAYREAVVGGEGPTNHMALIVDGEWICDGGLGEGFVEPLPLAEGRTENAAGLHWTVSPEAGGAWWVAQHEWGAFTGFRIQPQAVAQRAFEPHHRRMSTDPASTFVQTLVVVKPADDRITALRARTLSERGPAVETKRVLDREQFEDALTGLFALRLDAGRIERLWALACAQHDTFTQARARP